MSQRAWMPMYWADYLADTGHLSAAEHGAYLLLIAQYWRDGGPLPDDDTKLARLVRMRRDEWAEARAILADFFTIEGGVWLHARIDEELSKAEDIIAKRREAGKAGASKRHGKCQANATQMDKQTAAPSPTPTQETSSLRSEGERVSAPRELEVVPEPEDDPVPAMVDAWNAMAADVGLPLVQKITKARRAKALQRLRDCGGMDGWNYAVERIRGSPFLTGDNRSGWKADFDFALQESSFTKLMEGRYDGQHDARPAQSGSRQSAHDAFLAGFAASAAGH